MIWHGSDENCLTKNWRNVCDERKKISNCNELWLYNCLNAKNYLKWIDGDQRVTNKGGGKQVVAISYIVENWIVQSQTRQKEVEHEMILLSFRFELSQQ